jgi:hypothetical protein
MLGAAAFQALQAAEAVEPGPVAVRREFVELDRLRIDPEKVRWAREVVAASDGAPPPGQVDGLPDDFYARTYLRMHAVQDAPDRAEVMALRVGSLAVVGLPGEVFCEFGLEIQRRCPAGQVLVVELANDAIGYLPTPEAFEQGGYESSPGSTRYTASAGRRLCDAALGLLEELFA